MCVRVCGYAGYICEHVLALFVSHESTGDRQHSALPSAFNFLFADVHSLVSGMPVLLLVYRRIMHDCQNNIADSLLLILH